MKISSINCYTVNIPFIRPFEVWRGVAKTKNHVIVEVETDDGITGIGEASPFLYYAPETQEDILATLMHYMPELILGRDPFELEALSDLLHQTIDGHHFSKAAVEMALWDIIGKKLGVPLYQLLGGRCRRTVPLVAILMSNAPDELAREAKEWVDKGFSRLKVKIGYGLEKDMAKVHAVREAVGTDISIRVDAEEAYDLKGSLSVARHLQEYGIELLSQPIPRYNYDDMAILRKSIDIPLLVDESIVTPEDVMLAVQMGTGDLVNIKVVKSGGILNAKRMSAIAKAAGKDCLVGSMLEMGPGTLFAAHFAVSTVNVTYANEIIGPLMLVDDILKQPIHVQNGELLLPETPGLGIELDRSKLKKYSAD
jgi:L-alanine-DL-glutamate epimerase-like enolase superfamily enzyme